MTDRAASLTRHLADRLGRWPPETGLDVVGHPARDRPGPDGLLHPLLGVSDGEGLVLSVPPDAVEPVELLGGLGPDVLDLPAWRQALVQALGLPRHRPEIGVFRATDDVADVTDLADLGTWVAGDDPRLPGWLRPFGAPEVLLLREEGAHVGVGITLHDPFGAELVVGTDPALRGRGYAARLVATAARRLLHEGRAVTCHHASDHLGAAAVAERAGLRDRGWRIVELTTPG